MTERRRRPHPALGARWVSAGLAVAATVGITSYLEIDSVLHPTALAAASAPSATAPPATAPPATAPPATAPPTTIAPATAVPGTGRIVVPPPPPVTVTTIPSVTAPVYVPPTHARTRGSNG